MSAANRLLLALGAALVSIPLLRLLDPGDSTTMKLTYFGGRYKAEVARILLAYGNVDYENVRIKDEDWADLKESEGEAHELWRQLRCSYSRLLCQIPDTPFGLLPNLEVDGQVIAESIAICRFIAKKVGLYGSDPLEQAQIDMVIDNLSDLDQGRFINWLHG